MIKKILLWSAYFVVCAVVIVGAINAAKNLDHCHECADEAWNARISKMQSGDWNMKEVGSRESRARNQGPEIVIR